MSSALLASFIADPQFPTQSLLQERFVLPSKLLAFIIRFGDTKVACFVEQADNSVLLE